MLLLVLTTLASLGILGVKWLDGLVFRTISVKGNVYALTDELMEAARADTGMALFDIDPALIADRVERHPWVRKAEVTRLPPSTLLVNVKEREPVMLVIDEEGVPSTYLDVEGYTMPVTSTSTFDLPLLTGARLPMNPTQPIDSQEIASLLEAVKEIGPRTNALLSVFLMEPSGQVVLRTAPINDQGSIVVRLGRRDFDKKLRQLHAFWSEAIVTRPGTRYEWIDLRFGSQIVTREFPGT